MLLDTLSTMLIHCKDKLVDTHNARWKNISIYIFYNQFSILQGRFFAFILLQYKTQNGVFFLLKSAACIHNSVQKRQEYAKPADTVRDFPLLRFIAKVYHFI